MTLHAPLRRAINVAALALVLLAFLAALLLDWWAVDARSEDARERIFDAAPFRSEAHADLGTLDTALDVHVAMGGWVLVAGAVLVVLGVAAHDFGRRWVRLPGWISRTLAGAAALFALAAALVAMIAWPDAWSEEAAQRSDGFITHAEWHGEWRPDAAEEDAMVYRPQPGWFFACAAALLAFVATAFDYVAARAWFPAGAPAPHEAFAPPADESSRRS